MDIVQRDYIQFIKDGITTDSVMQLSDKKLGYFFDVAYRDVIGGARQEEEIDLLVRAGEVADSEFLRNRAVRMRKTWKAAMRKYAHNLEVLTNERARRRKQNRGEL